MLDLCAGKQHARFLGEPRLAIDGAYPPYSCMFRKILIKKRNKKSGNLNDFDIINHINKKEKGKCL